MNMSHKCPRKEQPKKCSIQHRLVEGLDAIQKLDGEVTLNILVGSDLSRFGIQTDPLPFVVEDRDAWKLQLEQLPPHPFKDKRV